MSYHTLWRSEDTLSRAWTVINILWQGIWHGVVNFSFHLLKTNASCRIHSRPWNEKPPLRTPWCLSHLHLIFFNFGALTNFLHYNHCFSLPLHYFRVSFVCSTRHHQASPSTACTHLTFPRSYGGSSIIFLWMDLTRLVFLDRFCREISLID